MPGPSDDTKPVKIGPRRFYYDELDYYLVLLPAANRSDQDKAIFTVVNALCCLRERYPDTYDERRRADVEAVLQALKEDDEGRPYVTRWNDAGAESSEQQEACQKFRDHYKMLVEDWKQQLGSLEVVESFAVLDDVDLFPTDALDYLCIGLCIGMSMGMPKADLAKALERLFRTPEKKKPFTADNVELMFNYLKSTGSGVYDIYAISDAEGEKDEKFQELLTAAQELDGPLT
ncbi:MAG: hypothetical protein LQ337_004153 [Flavoplaca oasis]|nr:MAG: hypothetical protein LQ337_004153 [Flavoplaca oasis]